MALFVRKFIGQWREFGDEIDSDRYDDQCGKYGSMSPSAHKLGSGG